MEVIGYARVSSGEQGNKGFSIEEQVEYIKKYVKENDLALDTNYGEEGFFIDEDKSGEILNKNLIELLDLVDKKRVGAIVVMRFDRFTTKAMSVFNLISKLHERKISLYSIQDQFVSNKTNAGAYINRILKYDQQASGKKIKNALGWKKKNNERLGTTPYGFKTVRKNPDGQSELLEDPEEMEIINEIFKYHNEGWSMSGIAKYLNGRGYPTKNARNKTKESKWYASTISYILKNSDLYEDALTD